MRAYYKVTQGPTYDIIHAHVTKHKEANDAALKWADSRLLSVRSILGECVYFKEGFIPDKIYWNKKSQRGSHTPNRKTEEGRKILKELNSLPQFPSGMSLITDFSKGGNLNFMQVNITGTPGIKKSPKEDLYRLDIDDYWLPEDRTGLEEIKSSEYHQD